ncbi:hypothetical protein D3C71_936180 [compost metagenome]
MLRRHLHHLRLHPFACLEFSAAGVGELACFAAADRQHRDLRRQVRGRVTHQQLLAVRRQAEIFHAIERGHFTHGAAVGIDVADFVIARPLLVAQEVEAAAIGADFR